MIISGTKGVIQVYYDGTLLSDLNLTNLNTGTSPLTVAGVGDGNSGRTATFYVDNVNVSAGNPTSTFMDSGGDAVGNNLTAEEGFWTGHSGTVAVSTSTAETGSNSLQITSSAATSYVYKASILSDSGTRISMYVNFASFPSATTQFLTACASGTGNGVLGLAITNTGVLEVQNNAGNQLGSTTTLSTNTWYRIDLSYVVNNANGYSFIVYVNGAPSITYSQTSVEQH